MRAELSRHCRFIVRQPPRGERRATANMLADGLTDALFVNVFCHKIGKVFIVHTKDIYER